MADPRDWIVHHAYRPPDAIAQIDIATGRRFTYARMQDRVSHIAGHLRQNEGLNIGDVVAVLGPNSSDMFDIDFACGRIGAVLMPMNIRLAAPELAWMLKDAKAGVAAVAMANKTARIIWAVLISGRVYHQEPPVAAA